MRERGFSVSDRALYRWCREGLVLADRMMDVGGESAGPWVVGVNDKGNAVRAKKDPFTPREGEPAAD